MCVLFVRARCPSVTPHHYRLYHFVGCRVTLFYFGVTSGSYYLVICKPSRPAGRHPYIRSQNVTTILREDKEIARQERQREHRQTREVMMKRRGPAEVAGTFIKFKGSFNGSSISADLSDNSCSIIGYANPFMKIPFQLVKSVPCAE